MKTALTLTNPTPEELAGLRAALNFPSGFAVRRAQILLQVAAGKTAPIIAREMHCSHQGVRNIISAFNARGLACLKAQSSAPKSVKPLIQEPLSGRGCRIIPSFPPVKSPWLNPIEPKWLHAKRRIVEPDRLLTAAELRRRVVEAFDCTHEPDLIQPKKPARSKKVA